MEKKSKYTCGEYRQEMILLGLRKRLANKEITEKERREIQKEIKTLQSQMGLD